MSAPRVISQRALQELLKGNHKNFVSIKVGDEEFLRIHRPVAARFSRVWKSELSNPTCRVITVTFPSDPPAAAPPSEATANASNAAAKPQAIPPPPESPSNKDLLKFIVQWMELGGTDPKGKNAAVYPKDYRAGLERLRALAELLGADELVSRVKRDLGIVAPARRPRCSVCKKWEHPGFECRTCRECGSYKHLVGTCTIAIQKFMEREARRKERAEERAERERLRKENEERLERLRKKREEAQERWEKKREEEMIRKGQIAVGDGGKTILRWEQN